MILKQKPLKEIIQKGLSLHPLVKMRRVVRANGTGTSLTHISLQLSTSPYGFKRHFVTVRPILYNVERNGLYAIDRSVLNWERLRTNTPIVAFGIRITQDDGQHLLPVWGRGCCA